MLLAAHWAYEYDFTFCSFPLVIIHVIKASETSLGLWKTGKKMNFAQAKLEHISQLNNPIYKDAVNMLDKNFLFDGFKNSNNLG